MSARILFLLGLCLVTSATAVCAEDAPVSKKLSVQERLAAIAANVPGVYETKKARGKLGGLVKRPVDDGILGCWSVAGA